MERQQVKWARRAKTSYEVSTTGDARFSALIAKMPDGRTIEMWYQCDVKGHDIGGHDWQAGKGKPSRIPWTREQQWELYLSLWKLWSIQHVALIQELAEKVKATGDHTLTDCFASGDINQARALATIINEWGL